MSGVAWFYHYEEVDKGHFCGPRNLKICTAIVAEPQSFFGVHSIYVPSEMMMSTLYYIDSVNSALRSLKRLVLCLG